MAENSGKKIVKSAEQDDSKITVKGGIHAGRDVIMGDQTNYIYQQIAQIESPAEFLSALRQVQAEVLALRQQPALPEDQAQMVDIVEGQVSQVVEEAQKPQPLGAKMTALLSSAKATLDLISGTIGSAVDLGVKIGGLAAIAQKLFGG